MKKRILIFSTSYYPFVGGAEVAVKEITDRLGGEFDFDLIVAKQDKSLSDIQEINAVTVYRVGWGSRLLDKLWVPLGGARLALKLKRRHDYAAFWCIMASYAAGAAYIANIFSWREVPIILTLQEGDSEEHLRYRWLGLISLSWYLALRRTRVLTAISTYLLERGEKFGFKGVSILIPNGVNYKKFDVPKAARDDGKVVLITASRLTKKNAIDDIIEALAHLPDNVVFRILGTGELEEELKTQVAGLNLERRVDFAGYVDHSQMPYHFSRADIFIRPSLSEGMGNSFIEAMAAGLPVIATNVGGIPDFIKDGETGLFVNVHDPKDIAEKVKRLIDDEALRQKLIENAKALVKEKYDWNLIAEDMKNRVFRVLL
ncbi:glycosyltransferase family 4 protein [Candidatus Parcubacteria bacterium]|nr:glycosyltransferase family 4 protein [Candidatus Parcubacteria bacterium]